MIEIITPDNVFAWQVNVGHEREADAISILVVDGVVKIGAVTRRVLGQPLIVTYSDFDLDPHELIGKFEGILAVDVDKLMG